MKILITGSSGYLGGRLSKYLSHSYKLRTASRKFKRFDKNDNGNIEKYEIDWTSLKSIEKSLDGIDIVIHLAGLNAKNCEQNPLKAEDVNVHNTKKLVELSIKKGIKKFIYLSTAHVYSNPLEGVITENSDTLGDHPYATTHLAAEKLILSHHANGVLNAVIVRLSNAFGYPIFEDTNCWMLVVNDLCKQLVLNNKMIIRSNGKQRRNFISMDDTLRAINHFIDLDKQDNPIFNLGSLWNPTIKEVAKIIAKRYESITSQIPDIKFDASIDYGSNFLDYKIDKLLNSGFSFYNKDSVFDEIDDLIRMCFKFYEK